MIRFLSGFACALVLIVTFWAVDAFQLFRDPIPLTGEQFREEWIETAKDSHGRWLLTNMNSDELFLELQYPMRKFKFVVRRTEILVNRPIGKLPMDLKSGDVALASDSVHPLIR